MADQDLVFLGLPWPQGSKAIKEGDVGALRQFVENYLVDIDQLFDGKQTLLHEAAANLDIYVLQFLMSRGPKLLPHRDTGLTPLHILAENTTAKPDEVCTALAMFRKAEFDMTIQDLNGRTPYLCAIEKRNAKTAIWFHIDGSAVTNEKVPDFPLLVGQKRGNSPVKATITELQLSVVLATPADIHLRSSSGKLWPMHSTIMEAHSSQLSAAVTHCRHDARGSGHLPVFVTSLSDESMPRLIEFLYCKESWTTLSAEGWIQLWNFGTAFDLLSLKRLAQRQAAEVLRSQVAVSGYSGLSKDAKEKARALGTVRFFVDLYKQHRDGPGNNPSGWQFIRHFSGCYIASHLSEFFETVEGTCMTWAERETFLSRLFETLTTLESDQQPVETVADHGDVKKAIEQAVSKFKEAEEKRLNESGKARIRAPEPSLKKVVADTVAKTLWAGLNLITSISPAPLPPNVIAYRIVKPGLLGRTVERLMCIEGFEIYRVDTGFGKERDGSRVSLQFLTKVEINETTGDARLTFDGIPSTPPYVDWYFTFCNPKQGRPFVETLAKAGAKVPAIFY